MEKSPLPNTVSRRHFMQKTALGAAGLTVGLSATGSALAAGQKIPVGLELYSIRDQCKNDLPSMLVMVSKTGYKGVEFAGYHGFSAKDLRKMLDDNGLVCCGTHTPYESVQPDNLGKTIEFNRIIGNKFLIVPWMEGKSKQAWLDHAKFFNELSDKVKSEGMFVGYH